MRYTSVGFIHADDPDGMHRHTEVLECAECGGLVSANSFAAHDAWHAEIAEAVSPS